MYQYAGISKGYLTKTSESYIRNISSIGGFSSIETVDSGFSSTERISNNFDQEVLSHSLDSLFVHLFFTVICTVCSMEQVYKKPTVAEMPP